jgi:hypothetical protein
MVLESQVVDRDTATERPPAETREGEAVARLEAVGALRPVEDRVHVRPDSSLGVLLVAPPTASRERPPMTSP